MGALDDSYEEWLALHHHGNPDFPDDPYDPAVDQPLWPQPSEPDDPLGDGFRPAPIRPPRPVADIRLDLETARAYQERYRHRRAVDRWAQMMGDDNEADILRLEAELASATGDDATPPMTTPETERPVSGPLPGRLDVGEETLAQRDPEPPRWPRRAREYPVADAGL